MDEQSDPKSKLEQMLNLGIPGGRGSRPIGSMGWFGAASAWERAGGDRAIECRARKFPEKEGNGQRRTTGLFSSACPLRF